MMQLKIKTLVRITGISLFSISMLSVSIKDNIFHFESTAEAAFSSQNPFTKLASNLIKPKADLRIIETESPKVVEPQNKIKLNDIIDHTQAVYGPQETMRKEGFMWVDRKANQMVITLGSANGVKPGSKLLVYDGAEKIAEVIVESSFDVISYAVAGEDFSGFDKDYYQVTLDQLPVASQLSP